MICKLLTKTSSNKDNKAKYNFLTILEIAYLQSTKLQSVMLMTCSLSVLVKINEITQTKRRRVKYMN